MLIHHKKEFYKGLVLTIGFAVVLFYMFTPSFNGTNAFHASDNLFNSISKGSTYYIPSVLEGAKKFDGKSFEVTVFEEEPKYIPYAATILKANGIQVSPTEKGLRVSGDLGTLMARATEDSDAMFNNDGSVLVKKYSMEEKEAMYVWWRTMKEVKLALDRQKVFAPATYLEKNVINRAIEVGYNYYGIQAEKAADRWGILTFSLVFYVIYTMWWGFAIFFLFEGFGLEMKAGKKKEM